MPSNLDRVDTEQRLHRLLLNGSAVNPMEFTGQEVRHAKHQPTSVGLLPIPAVVGHGGGQSSSSGIGLTTLEIAGSNSRPEHPHHKERRIHPHKMRVCYGDVLGQCVEAKPCTPRVVGQYVSHHAHRGIRLAQKQSMYTVGAFACAQELSMPFFSPDEMLVVHRELGLVDCKALEIFHVDIVSVKILHVEMFHVGILHVEILHVEMLVGVSGSALLCDDAHR